MKNTLKVLAITSSLFSSATEINAVWPWSNTGSTEHSTAVVAVQEPKQPGYIEKISHPVCRESLSLFIPPILADPACYLSILSIKKLLGD